MSLLDIAQYLLREVHHRMSRFLRITKAIVSCCPHMGPTPLILLSNICPHRIYTQPHYHTAH